MELTEVEKEWDREREECLGETGRRIHDEWCEKSKRVYRAMKETDLWPKDENDMRNFYLVTNILGSLQAKGFYHLVGFRDWLKETLDAAFQGKELDEDTSEFKAFASVPFASEFKVFGAVPFIPGGWIFYQDFVLIISTLQKLINAGVNEFTLETIRFLEEKKEMEFPNSGVPARRDEDAIRFLVD